MSLLPRLSAAALTLLAGLAGLTAFATPAHAADGFKYWGYYHLAGDTWESSKKGPSAYTAQDGDVEGFRFASTTATDPSRPPRALPSFADICAGTQAAQDEKRVGIVLDYGTAQDAVQGDTPPQARAACAVVPAEATTQQALESVKPLRVEGGLVCAIGGYPSEGCGDPVQDVTVPKNEKPVDLALPSETEAQAADDGGVPWSVVGVGAAVVVLGGGAVMVARRRA